MIKTVFSAWHLEFPVLSHPLYGICVKNLNYESVYFKRARQRPRILLTDNIHREGSCSVNGCAIQLGKSSQIFNKKISLASTR